MDNTDFETLINERLKQFLLANGRGSINACNLLLADIIGLLVKQMSGTAKVQSHSMHLPTATTNHDAVLDAMTPVEAVENVLMGEMLNEQRVANHVSETMLPGDGMKHVDHSATIAVSGESAPMMVMQGHDSDLPVVEEALFPDPASEPVDAVTSTLVHDEHGERSVHYIDVGDMPAQEVREHLQEAKAEIDGKTKKPSKKV